jgi:phosphoenolpyruvate carboxykinase (GTP)
VAPGTGTLFTNVARNDNTQQVWWEGRTPAPPADITGWRDWTGRLIAERQAEDAGAPWAHPNSRFTTTLANVPNLAPDFADPKGVPVDAIIFGGRTRDREPLIRAITDLAEGVYDGLTLGAEATFAAEGAEGLLGLEEGEVRGRQTPVGIIPAKDELDLDASPPRRRTSRRSSRSTRRGGSRR